MIGDSITASAAKRYGGELCNTLVPLGWQVEVDAEPSRFVDFGNDVLDKRLSAKWDAALRVPRQQLPRRPRVVPQAAGEDRAAPVAEPVLLLTVTLFEDSRRRGQRRDHIGQRRVPQRAPARLGLDRRCQRRDDPPRRRAALDQRRTRSAGVDDGRRYGQGPAPSRASACRTSFNNDSGLSVNGSRHPAAATVGTPTSVKPTQTTVKSPPTTVGGGGGATPTTKPAVTPTTTPTPPTQVATTVPATTSPPNRRTTTTTPSQPPTT